MERKEKEVITSFAEDGRYVDFYDRELAGYVYLKNFDKINLPGKQELSANFLRHVFTENRLEQLMKAFLYVLEKEDEEKYKSMKKENGFEADEVMEAMSDALMENFRSYGVIFKIIADEIRREYVTQPNPIKKLVEKSFFKNFFDGLNLPYGARAFFVLNLINAKVGWMFPRDRDDEYKSRIFENLLEKDVVNRTVYTRNLNNHFIKLGLFSDEWKVADYIVAFFEGEKESFVMQKMDCDSIVDVHSPASIRSINFQESLVFSDLVSKSWSGEEKGIFCLNGTENFRLFNYLNFLCYSEFSRSIYRLKQDVKDTSRKEKEFYIYANSVWLKNSKSKLMVLDEEILSDFWKGEDKNEALIRMVNGQGGKSFKGTLLENIQCPVVLCVEKMTKERKRALKENGIDILYDLKLKVPAEDQAVYRMKAIGYFCGKGFCSEVLKAAVDGCLELKLSPGKWPEVVQVMKLGKSLSYDLALLLMKNKFGEEKKKGAVKENKHYCLEAINATESVPDMLKALKNAEEFHREHPDESYAARIKLSGLSGTGKTEYTKFVAKSLNKELKVIRASEILGMYVGQTEQNIRAAFEEAAEKDAVLLIDEADSFLHCRGDNVNHHNDSKVNEFLVQMEEFPGILFCNTNMPENLDKATDRRFHFNVGFLPVTKDGLKLLTDSYFSEYGITEEQLNRVYQSGDVTPGDFGAVFGKIRFIDKEKINADYITEELCKIVAAKTRSFERKIGFGD